MPTWQIILIAAVVIVVVVVTVAAVVASSRRKSERLKQHFGAEYERTVSEAGDPKAAEKELAGRARRRDKLDIVALSPEALADFTNRWQRVQTGFVDDPGSAVGAADQLVTEVMRQRGYPIDDDFEQQAADISVDHPQIVENYRAAHGIHLAQQRGDVGTEQQREAFVHYRALFEKLLDTTTDNDMAKEARA
ncbi:MAG: hypothetical protein QOH57_2880 [Mycobacterium sp.]|jgi:hypothetical protein|nr:hypothetical protein [Mycobacterium sp.]